MSLQSFVGDALRGAQNTLSDVFSSAKGTLENIVGSTSTALTNVWSGGFAGISETGIVDLKNALNNYINNIEATIASFDEAGNIENALKGNIQTAAQDFIAAIKQLLQAWVTQMRVNLADLDSAYKNYTEAAADLSTQTSSNADSIRSQAQEIRLD